MPPRGKVDASIRITFDRKLPSGEDARRRRRPLQRTNQLCTLRLGVEMGEAGFGGGEGFFFFAEGEADMGGAVVGVAVEAGAGDAGYADFFDEVFGEGDVAGIG